MKIKKICCIGAGYVGGPTMTIIADRCRDIDVTVVDIKKEKIKAWNSDRLPIYEPGLEPILRSRLGKNLHFSHNVDQAIFEADCVFISVNTPTKTNGLGSGKASDLKYLEQSARRIASASKEHTIVVEKSTLPVKSAETIKTVLEALGQGKSYEVLSNPEFMAEGSAVNDLLNPDRVLIGGDSASACNQLSAVYEQWVPKEKIIKTNLWSSEMAKLASNAFLAQRVSSINALSAFCEVTGADVLEVSNAIGKDTRIGGRFLQAGPGFGGSCFRKDILNLVYLCEHYGLHEVAKYWEQVVAINEWQKQRIAKIVTEKLFNTLSGKMIAILGFAFKKNTNDCRETPAISICKYLLEEGACLKIYDPRVDEGQIQTEISRAAVNKTEKIKVNKDVYDAINGTDAILLLTEWDEFNRIDWQTVSKIMRPPSWVFDTRGVLDSDIIAKEGLKYWRLGKGDETTKTYEIR